MGSASSVAGDSMTAINGAEDGWERRGPFSSHAISGVYLTGALKIGWRLLRRLEAGAVVQARSFAHDFSCSQRLSPLSGRNPLIVLVQDGL
jgi:hypothetical protein